MTLQEGIAPGGIAVGWADRAAFGTMTFGSQVDLPAATRMVGRCLDAGVTMFDSSNSYNDGRSEEILGAAVRGVRDRVTLCTKAGGGSAPLGALGREPLLQAARASLRRLATDHIDIYYLHRPDRATPIEVTMQALATLVEDGSIRGIGVSNFASWQVLEISRLARELGLPEIAATQPVYHLLARRIEVEYAELTAKLGVPNICYNPLAGGLLTGKHSFSHPLPESGRFTNAKYVKRYWRAETFAAVDQLSQIAAGEGVTLVELALRWVIAQPVVGRVLFGASSETQLAQNLSAFEGPPPSERARAACDDVWAVMHGAGPDFTR